MTKVSAALLLVSTVFAFPASAGVAPSDRIAVEEIKTRANPAIDFAGRFSSAVLNCGTGCASFWFLDRRSGAVVPAPGVPPQGYAVWDMSTRADSEVVAVLFGPSDGIGNGCLIQRFRWQDTTFAALEAPLKTSCPEN